MYSMFPARSHAAAGGGRGGEARAELAKLSPAARALDVRERPEQSIGCKGRRCKGGRAECVGRLGRVPTAPEGHFGIFGAATATSLGRIATPRARGGHVPVLGRHGEVRGILVSILG